jgi:2-polyprenyl-3-methyl-5-hydroxy-6-metoxy-1,4-benzoquinol methylase
MLISESYLFLNKELHKGGSYGQKGDKWAPRVRALIENLNPSTILDYGCGQGALARSLAIDIHEYDPAIAGKDSPPEAADLVICTDVLEHIEPDCLEEVLNHLAAQTKTVLFAVISTRPARKVLADGRNAHLIVQPWEWWRTHLATRFTLTDPVTYDNEFEILLHPKK